MVFTRDSSVEVCYNVSLCKSYLVSVLQGLVVVEQLLSEKGDRVGWLVAVGLAESF